MYLLKPNKKHSVAKKQFLFESLEELTAYVKFNKIWKFSVINVDKFVAPAPKEPNPALELRQRLVPLSQAQSDEVKL